jgi:hypothetical protein
MYHTQAERGVTYSLPRLINAYALDKMDVYGNHQTAPGSRSKPNPHFRGRTMWQDMCDHHPLFFRRGFDSMFTFDGDTVEFMTRGFYRATVSRVIAEWTSVRAAFEEHLARWWTFVPAAARRRLGRGTGPAAPSPQHGKDRGYKPEHEPEPEYGQQYDHAPPRICAHNYGLATQFSTNFERLSIFNNMTMHINITLPCVLDPATGLVAHEAGFVAAHRALARAVQWLEPLWIAVFGAGDCLAQMEPKVRGRRSASLASQRCAVSRYIGIGTYDVESMPRGKIMTVPLDELRAARNPFWWGHAYYRSGAEGGGVYARRAEMGLDINFGKHTNHGLELRFWDAMAPPCLRQVMELLVSLGDLVCAMAPQPSRTLQVAPVAAADSPVWNSVVLSCLDGGRRASLDAQTASAYRRLASACLGPPGAEAGAGAEVGAEVGAGAGAGAGAGSNAGDQEQGPNITAEDLLADFSAAVHRQASLLPATGRACSARMLKPAWELRSVPRMGDRDQP